MESIDDFESSGEVEYEEYDAYESDDFFEQTDHSHLSADAADGTAQAGSSVGHEVAAMMGHNSSTAPLHLGEDIQMLPGNFIKNLLSTSFRNVYAFLTPAIGARSVEAVAGRIASHDLIPKDDSGALIAQLLKYLQILLKAKFTQGSTDHDLDRAIHLVALELESIPYPRLTAMLTIISKPIKPLKDGPPASGELNQAQLFWKALLTDFVPTREPQD